MKVIRVCVLLFYAGTAGYAQDFYNYNIARQFLDPVPVVKIPLNSNRTMLLPDEDAIDPHYFNAWRIGNDDFNFIYYDYWHKKDDTVDCGLIEAYGQKFPLKDKWIGDDEPVSARNILPLAVMTYGDIYLFEHKTRRYALWVDQLRGSNPWLFYNILFDITDRQHITLLVYARFCLNYDDPEIGFYPDKNGKLCTIITGTDETSHGDRTRLYCIEDGQLAEVLDREGRHIELIYNWDKWTPDKITVLKINIPKNIQSDELTLRRTRYFHGAAADDEIHTGKPPEQEIPEPDEIDDPVTVTVATKAVSERENGGTLKPAQTEVKTGSANYGLTVINIGMVIIFGLVIFIIVRKKIMKPCNKLDLLTNKEK